MFFRSGKRNSRVCEKFYRNHMQDMQWIEFLRITPKLANKVVLDGHQLRVVWELVIIPCTFPLSNPIGSLAVLSLGLSHKVATHLSQSRDGTKNPASDTKYDEFAHSENPGNQAT